MKRAGFRLSDDALNQLLARLDIDNDGTIEYHEFVRFAQVQSQADVSDRDRTDLVGTDKVSKELRAFVRDVTNRSPADQLRHREILAAVVDFNLYVMSSCGSWRYVRPTTRWFLTFRSLGVLACVLTDQTVDGACWLCCSRMRWDLHRCGKPCDLQKTALSPCATSCC